MKLSKPISPDTPAGAVVMACGIFINGPMKNIYFLEKNAGRFFTIILLLLWGVIASSYVNTILKGTIRERHLRNPIKSFAVGTWIAGTSVLGIAICQRLTWFAFFARFLFFFNIALWGFYMGICIRNYIQIYKTRLFNRLHGVLLLATVSTQSLVVLGTTAFGRSFPHSISRMLISIGIAFYMLNFLLIFYRYAILRFWSIEEDWQDTNCIIHGAMSITGLACVSSGAVSYDLILGIWLWIILCFLIVESMEVYRAWRRIKKYGFMRGIAVYDVAQWSRIFTFGMFYAFTLKFNLKLPTLQLDILFSAQNLILRYGKWIVAFILVVEWILFFKDNTVNSMESSA